MKINFKTLVLTCGTLAQAAFLVGCGSGGSSNPSPQTNNTPAPAQFAYIANNKAAVSLCSVNPTTGGLSNCAPTANGTESGTINITLDPKGEHAYVTQVNGKPLLICSVGSNGGLGDCTPSNTGISSTVAFNSAGTYAYVLGYKDHSISVCAVNQTTGQFDSCNLVNSDIKSGFQITLNSANTYLYITNGGTKDDASITVCKVNQANGDLTNCAPTGSGFAHAYNVVLNQASTQAYVSNSANASVSLCQVNQANGQLEACATTGTGFSYPYGMSFDTAGKHLYVANSNDKLNSVTLCNVQSNGQLSNCAISGNGFAVPIAITLK